MRGKANNSTSLVSRTNPIAVTRPLGSVCGVILSLMLLLVVLPIAVQAQYYYTTNDGTITITRYVGTTGALTIPQAIDGLPVSKIGDWAFYDCNSLTSVTIPDNVIKIGDHTFYGCSNLSSISIGKGVANIGPYAFVDCSSLSLIIVDPLNSFYSSTGDGVLFDRTQIVLVQYPGGSDRRNYKIPDGVTQIGDDAFHSSLNLTNVTIPISTTSIGHGAFCDCANLASVTIPDNVTKIGNRTFYGCSNLRSIIIGKGVSQIGPYAFVDCSSLSLIIVDPLNSFYSSTGDGVLFNRTQTVLFQYPVGNDERAYKIPNGVTHIGDDAFFSSPNLTNVTIPTSVTSIGHRAFCYCANLASVIIPGSITDIESDAFTGCSRLTTVDIPISVTNIACDAFSSCRNLTSITVESMSPIYSSSDGVLFNKAQTTLILFPGGKAGNYVCPTSVTSIGRYAFCDCKELSGVNISSSVTSIEEGAFMGCSSLTSVTVPDYLETIANWVFGWCNNLTSVTMGASVSDIGSSAFWDCTNLTRVYFRGNAPSLEWDMLWDAENATIYHLEDSTGWGPTFGGQPTEVWRPELQIGDGSFGVKAEQFGFNTAWASGKVLVVESCTNLAHPTWFPAVTNTLTNGSSYFGDPQWSNHSSRFYRLRSL